MWTRRRSLAWRGTSPWTEGPRGAGIPAARARELIRAVILRLHLWVAVAAGLFIATMAVTGAVIACEDAAMSLAERRRSVAPQVGTRRVPPADLVAAAAVWGAGRGAPFAATLIEYRSSRDAAVRVHAGRDRRVFVDPWTGDVVGGGFPFLEGFFEEVRGWHRWLGATGPARRTGRGVTGAANVAFLFLLLTGPVLWIPRRVTRAALAWNLLPRRRSRGPARHRNRHAAIGIWSVLPLVGISATAVVLSYPAVGDRVYGVVGAAMPDRRGPGDRAFAGRVAGPGVGGSVLRGEPGGEGGLAGALAAASARFPEWRSITLEVPGPRDERIRAVVRNGRVGQPRKRNVVVVDRASGAVSSVEGFGDRAPDRRAQEWVRYAHTGEHWGLAGQALAGLVALAPVGMVWTGFSVALVTLRARRRRRGS